jgi:hypothetical protein
VKLEVAIHKNPKDKVLGHFGFSATRDSKEQGYSLCPDFAKREISKEQALGHFDILATRGLENKGTRRLTREVPVSDKCPFWFGARSRPLVVCCGSSHLALGKANWALCSFEGFWFGTRRAISAPELEDPDQEVTQPSGGIRGLYQVVSELPMKRTNWNWESSQFHPLAHENRK